MTRWRLTGFFCVLAMLGVLSACGREDPPRAGFTETCADPEILAELRAQDLSPSEEELSGMSEEERRTAFEMMEDAKRAPDLLMSVCELSESGAFPGVGSISEKEYSSFWVARARDKDMKYVLDDTEPAAAERECAQLWFMVLEVKERAKFQYFLCDTESEFVLISAYEKSDGAWESLVLADSAEAGGAVSDLKVELAVSPEAVAVGQIPEFTIKITNQTEMPVKVLDVRDRPDLQHSYSDVEIVPLDNEVEVLLAISDPGPIGEEDFSKWVRERSWSSSWRP